MEPPNSGSRDPQNVSHKMIVRHAVGLHLYSCSMSLFSRAELTLAKRAPACSVKTGVLEVPSVSRCFRGDRCSRKL
jgi:hypothetical protein